MVEETNLNGETEIHVIPAEFYGGASAKSAAPLSSNNVIANLSKISAVGKSPKILLATAVLIFAVVVSGFAYYYIRQANLARQKSAEPSAAPPAPVVQPRELETAVPAVTSTPAETESAAVVPPAPVLLPSAIFPFKNYIKASDADNDDLTDEEEKIYGTAPDQPDSDSDGYVDGLEVKNLYNPGGFKPVRLLDSGKVKEFSNPVFNYVLYYPALWSPQALDANSQNVLFGAETGEFVEVSTEDNPLRLGVKEWYLGQSPGVSSSQLTDFATKEKSKGIVSPDELAIYLPFEDRIFVVNYNIGLKTEINFLTTFRMMAASFRFFVPAPFSETAATSSPEFLPTP